MKKLAFIVFSMVVLTVMTQSAYAYMGQKPQRIPAPVIRTSPIAGSTADGEKKCNPATADWEIIPGSCFDRGTYIICRMQNTCSGEQRAVTIPKKGLPGNPYDGVAR